MNDQHTLVKHMKLHKHDHPFPLILLTSKLPVLYLNFSPWCMKKVSFEQKKYNEKNSCVVNRHCFFFAGSLQILYDSYTLISLSCFIKS